MSRIKRRAAYYLLFIGALIVVASITYDFGMRTFEPGPYPPEGTELSIIHSMQVVVETFTATGYGSDSPWASTEMNLLVMVLDITGVGLFFLALPAVLLPLFRDALSPSVPTELTDELVDHVIICSDTSRAEALINELDSNDIEYVFIEPDRERAISLDETGYTVVHADPESTTDLEGANVATARALVTDISDRVDASIVLAAREADEDVTIVSVVEDTDVERYHRLAGADHVLTPRQALGEGLAGKLTTGINTELSEAVRFGETFELAELPLHRGGKLAGKTLAESNLREEYGVHVIGAWFRGDFESPPPSNEPLGSGTILLVIGTPSELNRLRTVTASAVRRLRRGQTIVAGYGEVGRAVTEALSEASIPYTTVDKRDHDDVDIVGDATDPEVLREAGIETAESIVLALPNDTITEFGTLVVRDMDPTIEIIARAEKTHAIQKTYRAGADYVLSLATVSGRSIASHLVEDEAILSVDMNVELVQTATPRLVGKTLANAAIRERTGCTIVAVKRDESVIVDLDGDFEIHEGDELVVAGTDDDTNRFVEQYT